MNILIWVVCLAASALLGMAAKPLIENLIYGTATYKTEMVELAPTVAVINGVVYALLVLGAIFLARKLCKVWQAHRDEKEASENKSAHEARQICKHCGAKLPLMSRVCPQCGKLSDEIG